MQNYDRIADEIGWLLHGPELALGLFLFLVLYTVALLGTTTRAQLPGLAWLTRRTIYADLVLGLGLLATVPAVALALVLTSRSANQEAEHTSQLLSETTSNIAADLEHYFDQHLANIASLATNIKKAKRFDAASLTQWLEHHHATHPDYLTMLVANAHGEIVTTTAMVHGSPERVAMVNHNIRDRKYFIVPMRNGGVYASDVFQGRKLGNDPIIAISAQLSDQDGAAWGIVEGSLNLEQLSRFHQTGKVLGPSVKLLILDQKNRVIFSSDPTQYGSLEIITAQQVRENSKTQLYAHSRSNMGWQVIGTAAITPIHMQVWSDARVTLLWLLAAIIVSILLSGAIARRVTRPLITLNEAVRALELEGADADITPPPGTPDEIREVFGFLNSLSERLHNSYRQLTAAIEAGKHYREQLESTLSRRENEILSRTNELEHSNRSLHALSHLDQLTGLANRRRFTETAKQLWRHGLRERSPVAMVIMDIDYFKQYNDHYGHQAGDQCLAEVGAALDGCLLRPLDFVARYGGEEFVMIIADTSLPNVLAVAERTRKLIESLGIRHQATPDDLPNDSPNESVVTLSLGVAVEIPAPDSHYDALLKAADRALYHAKKMGRNCVAYSLEEEVAVFRDNNRFVVKLRTDAVVEFPKPVKK